MKQEIAAAAQWWSSHIQDPSQSKRFRRELEKRLAKKFENHWYPEEPTRGSGFRTVAFDIRLDSVLETAASWCGIQDIAKKLPRATVFINPSSVNMRMDSSSSEGRPSSMSLFPVPAASSTPPASRSTSLSPPSSRHSSPPREHQNTSPHASPAPSTTPMQWNPRASTSSGFGLYTAESAMLESSMRAAAFAPLAAPAAVPSLSAPFNPLGVYFAPPVPAFQAC